MIDFLSQLRPFPKFCNSPATLADEGLRDAFCQGLLSDTTKQSAWRAFPSAAQKSKHFSMNDLVTAAEVEAAQQTKSSTHEVTVVAALNKKFTKVPTKPPQVQSSGSSRRCRL